MDNIQFIVLIEWNKDPTNKKPVLQFEKVDLNRTKMTELQIPEYVDIVALSSRCKFQSPISTTDLNTAWTIVDEK